MKNNIKIGIAIGLMCVLLTSAIVIQVHTIEEAKKIVGSSMAQSELRDEVLRWKENYERIYKELENKENELENSRQESTKENGRLKQLQSELNEANKYLGLTEVTGSGIVLTLKDNDKLYSKDQGVDLNEALVHDGDLRQIINEFKNAGAEAISVNGQRIVGTTAINCEGAIVTINGVKVNSPFEIKAIGNIYSLRGIKRPGGYLSIMEDQGINAEFSESSNLKIEKYTGVNSPKYMKNAN